GDHVPGHGASTCITIRGTVGAWAGGGTMVGYILIGPCGGRIPTHGAGGGLMPGIRHVAWSLMRYIMATGLPLRGSLADRTWTRAGNEWPRPIACMPIGRATGSPHRASPNNRVLLQRKSRA